MSLFATGEPASALRKGHATLVLTGWAAKAKQTSDKGVWAIICADVISPAGTPQTLNLTMTPTHAPLTVHFSTLTPPC